MVAMFPAIDANALAKSLALIEAPFVIMFVTLATMEFPAKAAPSPCIRDVAAAAALAKAAW
jgi:hypothetical protein